MENNMRFVIDEFKIQTETWQLIKVNNGLFEIRMNNQIVSSHSLKWVAEEEFNLIKLKFKNTFIGNAETIGEEVRKIESAVMDTKEFKLISLSFYKLFTYMNKKKLIKIGIALYIVLSVAAMIAILYVVSQILGSESALRGF